VHAAEKKPAQAAPKATTTIKDTVSGMELVKVQGGCYLQGDQTGGKDAGKDATPAHEVCVDSFYMGKYEVTQADWQKVTGSLPKSEFIGDNLPVQMVSWEDVQKFILTLNKKSGKNYRLPTEAEWEYAARNGGKNEKWAGTSNDKEGDKFAWHNGNAQGAPHPVGQKQPNALGLYDMTGNVWEWVGDWYSDQTYVTDSDSPKLQNPQGPATGTDRVYRGGAFTGDLSGSTTAQRSSDSPTNSNTDIGFRLVLPATK
jgi:formylglycine-generating enzyme required for sulfatase activity